MGANTKIEWCDSTFNPWIGCTKVGPGCDNCYAEQRMDKRLHTVNWGPGQPRKRTSPANWREPVKWNAEAFYQCGDCGWRGKTESNCPRCAGEVHTARQRVFCASLADVFDNEVDPAWRDDLFALINATPNLDWLLLTKRIGNVPAMLATTIGWIPANAWLGATVVNQEEADRDIPKLLQVPAAKRFLSMEPLLGPVDLTQVDDGAAHRDVPREEWGTVDDEDSPPGLWWNALTGQRTIMHGGATGDWSRTDAKVDWVIVGGESGPDARPMHPDWARSLRDQCVAAGVPFLFKQWGEWWPIDQQQESDTNAFYRSVVKAREHESQSALDECCGRRCTVPTGVVHSDGSLHDITELMSFRQGTDAMMTFKVGKKAAGRLLDGRTWDEVPA